MSNSSTNGVGYVGETKRFEKENYFEEKRKPLAALTGVAGVTGVAGGNYYDESSTTAANYSYESRCYFTL